MNQQFTPPRSRKKKLKDIIKKFPLFANLVYFIGRNVRRLYYKDLFCTHAKIVNKGFGSLNKYIDGSKNEIIIGHGTRLEKTRFRIRGNNNKITIGDNCHIGTDCSFWMEGNNIHISIGNDTTFTMRCHFNAQEDNSSIEVGNDCMFSNKIIVRTSDSHPIYDLETGKRINEAKPIKIYDHVWIAPDSKIMKGAIIGGGSIIGSNTMVSKEIPENSLAVGMPAKVVKSNVRWSREDVIFNK